MDKKYKVLIIIFISYIIVVFGALFLYNRLHVPKYLVFSPDDVYEYKNHKIEKIKSKNLTKIKKLKFFEDGTKLGTYKIKYEGTLNVINADSKITHFSLDGLLGIPNNYQLTVYPIKREKFNDQDKQLLKQILDEHGILGYESLSQSEKIIYDINQDGNMETIYAVSNIFSESVYSTIFGFIYLVQDGKVTMLKEDTIELSNMYDGCRPFVNNIIDINRDKKPDMIIGCAYFDNLGTTYQLLENKEGKLIGINQVGG